MNEVMGLLSWIVFGLIAGLVARWLSPGKEPGGCAATVVIGILGALLGGWLATMLGFGGISGFDLRSLVVAVLGAVLVLLAYRMVAKRSRR